MSKATPITRTERAENVRRVLAGESYGAIARALGRSYHGVRCAAIREGVASTVVSTSRSPWNQQFSDLWKGTR